MCIPNIGPRERRRRVIGGLVMLGVTLAMSGYLLASDAPRWWRAFVVFPAAGAALGLFQAQARTCVALAARGLRNMDRGDEPMADSRELERVRVQARGVYMKALAAAILAAAIMLVY